MGIFSKEKKENVIVFNENEKTCLEILHKCNLKEAIWNNNCYWFQCSYNELIITFDLNYPAELWLKRTDGQTVMHEEISSDKTSIFVNIIKDKVTAYTKNLIISNLHNKKLNDDSCHYCGTKNTEERTNCINCGAIIKSFKN